MRRAFIALFLAPLALAATTGRAFGLGAPQNAAAPEGGAGGLPGTD